VFDKQCNDSLSLSLLSLYLSLSIYIHTYLSLSLYYISHIIELCLICLAYMGSGNCPYAPGPMGPGPLAMAGICGCSSKANLLQQTTDLSCITNVVPNTVPSVVS